MFYIYFVSISDNVCLSLYLYNTYKSFYFGKSIFYFYTSDRILLTNKYNILIYIYI